MICQWTKKFRNKKLNLEVRRSVFERQEKIMFKGPMNLEFDTLLSITWKGICSLLLTLHSMVE